MKLVSLHKIEPTGKSPGFGCGEGQPCEIVGLPIYAPTSRGEALRERRTAAMLTLLDVAKEFGLTSADVSGLERGARGLSEADWDMLLEWCREQNPEAIKRAKKRVEQALSRHQHPELDDVRVAERVCRTRMGSYLVRAPAGLVPLNIPCPEHGADYGESCWGPRMPREGTQKTTPWSVGVEHAGGGYRTVFTVGVQGFCLARDEDGDELKHCQRIAEQFMKAMQAAGAPPPAFAHRYPGVEAHKAGDPFRTTDCGFGCGCWMGYEKSGGPDHVDPFGHCPAAEGLAPYDDTFRIHGELHPHRGSPESRVLVIPRDGGDPVETRGDMVVRHLSDKMDERGIYPLTSFVGHGEVRLAFSTTLLDLPDGWYEIKNKEST